MITGRAWEFSATLLTMLGVVAIARAATSRTASLPTLTSSRVEPRLERPVPYPADSLLLVTVQHDLFRADRHPSTVSYDPAQLAVAAAARASPPKPALALVGLMAGNYSTAVLEGLPGADGPRVVRVGDVVSGLRITGIEKDRVLVIGMDTTWVLKVREPWKQ